MQKLSERHGVMHGIRAFRYLSIRLRSRPETQAIAAEVDAERAVMVKTEEAYAQALEERVAATAEVEYLDGCVDATVMDLAREIALMTRGRQDDPRYRKLFPSAPSALVRPIAGEAQERFVRSLVTRLREDKEYAPLTRYAEQLEQHQAALNEAIARRAERYQPETSTLTDRRVAMDHARRVYRSIYHRLQLLYPGDPALVESFFLALRTPSRGVTEEPESPTTPEVTEPVPA
jgi:hypothetical protein